MGSRVVARGLGVRLSGCGAQAHSVAHALRHVGPSRSELTPVSGISRWSQQGSPSVVLTPLRTSCPVAEELRHRACQESGSFPGLALLGATYDPGPCLSPGFSCLFFPVPLIPIPPSPALKSVLLKVSASDPVSLSCHCSETQTFPATPWEPGLFSSFCL